MTIEEANMFVSKSMKVILSCKNINQLNVAVKYADLVYKKISEEVGLVNDTQFISLTERSIGFAQCNIERIGTIDANMGSRA